MSNNYFQFKQFRVEQDDTAMKVGTDGVLLGSWAEMPNDGKVLDIGTGTGIVSLMLAQRFYKAQFLGIDIEQNAAQQARSNFNNSPFFTRLDAMHVNFHNFVENYKGKFDAFVCNPPFYKNSLDSGNARRNYARQDDYLNLEELFSGCAKLGKDSFLLSLVFPYDRLDEIYSNARSAGLYVRRRMDIYPKLNAIPNRVLIELANNKCDSVQDKLIIYESDGIYSTQFSEMLQDFYLKL